VPSAGSSVGVIIAQAGLADVKGTFVQAAGADKVALVVQDAGEVVEGQGGLGMITAKAGLADVEGVLVQGAGADKVALAG
jgi:hypothetical protein